MNKDRQKKIEKIIRKITSDFISQKLPDEDNIFGIINIWEIILSIDWSYVDIYISSFVHQESLAKILAKSAYLIQRNIGKKIGLRNNPKVRFRYDDSWRIWSQINETISEIDDEIQKYKTNKKI